MIAKREISNLIDEYNSKKISFLVKYMIYFLGMSISIYLISSESKLPEYLQKIVE